MNTAHTRTLRRALESCGGNAQTLAEILRVTKSELSAWLAGTHVPPTRVYLAALDVVARGPLRRSV
jgi:DNA-binding transcriptional regulator YiaG